MIRKASIIALGALVLSFVLIQLVPYRVVNPPIVQEPSWDSPETEALARRACFDCHSNEVQVPWYGFVAPIAWIVNDHVVDAREVLNFSEMNRVWEEADEAGEVVLEGEMPPAYYLALHRTARLTDAELRALADGLDRTLGGGHGDHGGSDD